MRSLQNEHQIDVDTLMQFQRFFNVKKGEMMSIFQCYLDVEKSLKNVTMLWRLLFNVFSTLLKRWKILKFQRWKALKFWCIFQSFENRQKTLKIRRCGELGEWKKHRKIYVEKVLKTNVEVFSRFQHLSDTEFILWVTLLKVTFLTSGKITYNEFIWRGLHYKVCGGCTWWKWHQKWYSNTEKEVSKKHFTHTSSRRKQCIKYTIDNRDVSA